MTVEISKGPVVGTRHLQAFLIFLSIVVNYVAKFNISVAVVAMTDSANANPNFEEYDWTPAQKSYILSSFFWGYAITQFPGGYLCRLIGAKWTMFISTLGSAAFAIITPFLVPLGWGVFCAIRVVQGLFQGFLFPAIHAHLAMWAPVEERNRLGALSNTGIECGTLVAMFLSGIIASSSMGWPGISYVSGGLGLIWCVIWLIFASDTPAGSRFISHEEKSYIMASLNQQQKGVEVQSIPVPWAAMLTSLPFWALLVARCAEAWGLSTLQTQIPSYMSGVLEMDVKSSSLYSSLPYLAMWIMSFVYLISSEILLSKKWLTLTGLRRSFSTIASWIPAIGLIGIGFLGKEQKTLAITLMIVTVGLNSAATIGSGLNTIDLSPNHAGIIMGIVNSAANCVPIITPLLVGFIVVDEHERSEWQIVFIISAVIFFFGNLFYIIFGSTDLQPWDDENFLRPNPRIVYDIKPRPSQPIILVNM
ncbi:putative inorganic phosphate cotransporter [Episyrphus balteatus]|uniref:putative inorganic phosphate cotransporter n=1 Tax=Episyrphus balteatus TaxID=286459 RepID=UPI002485D2B7|nr:putative inorganic phosphate cotransporter [Episyrphus balteatus]